MQMPEGVGSQRLSPQVSGSALPEGSVGPHGRRNAYWSLGAAFGRGADVDTRFGKEQEGCCPRDISFLRSQHFRIVVR